MLVLMDMSWWLIKIFQEISQDSYIEIFRWYGMITLKWCYKLWIQNIWFSYQTIFRKKEAFHIHISFVGVICQCYVFLSSTTLDKEINVQENTFHWFGLLWQIASDQATWEPLIWLQAHSFTLFCYLWDTTLSVSTVITESYMCFLQIFYCSKTQEYHHLVALV